MRATTILLFFFFIGMCSAKLYPAFSVRNYYLDEVLVTKTNPNETYSWYNPYIIKIKWNGSLLADEVHVIISDDMLKLNYNYNWNNDKSRIDYVLLDEMIEMKKIKAACFKLNDSLSYPNRIASYVNTRQLAEILKATGNRLILIEPGARNATRVLIDNLRPDYPCIHVIEESNGWTFAEP